MSILTYIYFMSPNDKDIVWLHGGVGTPPFSLEARREAGYLMRQLQQGIKLSMPQSRLCQLLVEGVMNCELLMSIVFGVLYIEHILMQL